MESPNPSLYFDYSIKGKYYLFLDYEELGNERMED